jgi:hypothetical protein
VLRSLSLALPLLLALACNNSSTVPEPASPTAAQPDAEEVAPEAEPADANEPFAATAGGEAPSPDPTPVPAPEDGSCEAMKAEAMTHFAPFASDAADRPSCTSDDQCTVSMRTSTCAGPPCGQALHVSEVEAYESAAKAAGGICEAYKEANCPPRGMPRCVKPEAVCVEGRCQRPSR